MKQRDITKRKHPVTMQLVPHDPTCRAIQQAGWRHPWSEWPDSSRTKFGAVNNPRRKGHAVWSVFLCNSFSCRAALAVNMSAVFNRLVKSGEVPKWRKEPTP